MSSRYCRFPGDALPFFLQSLFFTSSLLSDVSAFAFWKTDSDFPALLIATKTRNANVTPRMTLRCFPELFNAKSYDWIRQNCQRSIHNPWRVLYEVLFLQSSPTHACKRQLYPNVVIFKYEGRTPCVCISG